MPVTLEALPLRQEIEAHAARITGSAFEGLAPREHVGKTGNAFQAFVGRRDKVVRLQRRKIDRHAAEAAHRIHDEPAASFVDEPRDFFEGVQDSGGGLEVNDRDMRRWRFRGQQLPDSLWIG